MILLQDDLILKQKEQKVCKQPSALYLKVKLLFSYDRYTQLIIPRRCPPGIVRPTNFSALRF
jgi:hypothetical protein